MDALDALQLRDQEINKALSLANDILNEDPKQDPDTQVTLNDSDDMDTLIGKQQIYFFLQKSQLLNSQIFYVEQCCWNNLCKTDANKILVIIIKRL